jgi:uncharacterized peroxidase-related enzyme
MSWIGPPEDSPEVATLYDRDRATWGYLPNFAKVFAHRPAVYDGWRAMNGAIKNSMGARRYELASVAAALRLRSSYCSLAHGTRLAEHVGGLDAVAAIAGEPGAADLSAVDVAVLRLADRVAAGAADMTEDDLAELRDLGVDDAEILDVVLAAAARCFFATVLDAVGAQPDQAFADVAPAARDALTVGRPIEAPVRG